MRWDREGVHGTKGGVHEMPRSYDMEGAYEYEMVPEEWAEQ